jgi:hypothetical protein
MRDLPFLIAGFRSQSESFAPVRGVFLSLHLYSGIVVFRQADKQLLWSSTISRLEI